MSRKQLSKRDIEELNQKIGVDCIGKKDNVVLLDEKFILINNSASLFYHEGKLAPTLKFLQNHDLLKKITVDMGAVKFVIKGADIMRPGIVGIEEGIIAGDFVAIIDANNKKPLAIGIAQHGSDELRALSSGKVIKNVHFVGDDIWKMD